MTLVKFYISVDDLGFAYDQVVQAAEKGLLHAMALASRLEEYKNSEMKEFPLRASQSWLRLTCRRDVSPPDKSTEVREWTYQTATLGSMSALSQLPVADREEAWRTLRTCFMGGINHLTMFSLADVAYSQSVQRPAAAPLVLSCALQKLMVKSGEHQFIADGPVVGTDVTFLHVASAKRLLEGVTLALNDGEDVNSLVCPGRTTALLLACIAGSAEIALHLLKHGADPSLADERGETPLHWLHTFDQNSISTTSRALFKSRKQLSTSAEGAVLLSEGHILELGFSNGTPLHRAVGKRSLPAVRALLLLSADPLLPDSRGCSAIGLAARFHLADILELLLSSTRSCLPNQDHGPNLRLFNFAINSASPLQQFTVHGAKWREEMKRTLLVLLKIQEALYGYNGEDNFIRNAVAVGDTKMVELLLKNGAAEHMDKYDLAFGGHPALYHAIVLGHRWIFMAILNEGSDPLARFFPARLRQAGSVIFEDQRPNRSNYLHVCAEVGSDVFFIRQLIRRGVPVNDIDCDWHTALFLSIKAGYTDIASELIENGANLEEVLDGMTLLGQLAMEGCGIPVERFQYLLDKNSGSPSLKFLAGPRTRQSIFHLLAQDERVVRHPIWARDLLGYLIHQIGDRRLLDLQDTALDTALHYAAKCRNIEVLCALLNAGADPNIKNNKGETPLTLARQAQPSKTTTNVIQVLEGHGAVLGDLSGSKMEQVDKAETLWIELGFPKADKQWLDTALTQILKELQSKLLALFREDGFLFSENPWRQATRTVFDFLLENRSVLEKQNRIADFELAVAEMLRGFVDAVSLELKDGQLEVRLVKPFNKRDRKLPPGLLSPDITTSTRNPGVVITSTFISGARTIQATPEDFALLSLGSSPADTLEAPKPQISEDARAENDSDDEDSAPIVRIRQLDEGRFAIELHEPGQQIDHDTGLMAIGRGSKLARTAFGMPSKKSRTATVEEIVRDIKLGEGQSLSLGDGLQWPPKSQD